MIGDRLGYHKTRLQGTRSFVPTHNCQVESMASITGNKTCCFVLGKGNFVFEMSCVHE